MTFFPLVYHVTVMSSDRSDDTHSYCTLVWFSAILFFLGGVSLVQNTTQSSLWLWTHLLAANYMALLPSQFFEVVFESATVFTSGESHKHDFSLWNQGLASF